MPLDATPGELTIVGLALLVALGCVRLARSVVDWRRQRSLRPPRNDNDPS